MFLRYAGLKLVMGKNIRHSGNHELAIKRINTRFGKLKKTKISGSKDL